ncbi:MAG: CRISPR system precrRNA processing endoribonuclease RAMP protein Cas6 [Acidobacteriota bacterium]|nr:CRISPR system precrRNA processing endoribonuclease RAMP protein Cas6 [Acidobacteriota bacterium]
MRFEFTRLRFEITATETVCFPPGKAANKLRGAMGMSLPPEIFRPVAAEGLPSGLRDPPRPFVFRARHLDGLTFKPGEIYGFDLHVFSADTEPFVRVLGGVAHQTKMVIEIKPGAGPVNRLRVEFLSPTELKPNSPEFPVLFGRARDRISTLRAVYGPGPLDVDFKALGARAAEVRITTREIVPVKIDRRSSRTGQTHSIGGFTGVVEYEGELTGFMPYLQAAQWTGVGRHAVWGNGEIRVSQPI